MKLTKILSCVLSSACVLASFSGCTPSQSVNNDKDEQGRTMLSVGNWPAEDTTDVDYLERITNEAEKDFIMSIFEERLNLS